MLSDHDCDGFVQVLPGIKMKMLVWGLRMLMVEFRLKEGSVLPPHNHPHEQTGYCVSGRLRLVTAGEKRDVAAGDAWSIPGGTEHGAEAIVDSAVIEVFSPVREDYLPDGIELPEKVADWPASEEI